MARTQPPQTFSQAAAEIIRSIPAGQTLSYGGVAALAGRPGAPRAVLAVLRRGLELPWWRVIRSDGTLAEPVAAEQARRLRREGVRVVGRKVQAQREFSSSAAAIRSRPRR